MNVFVEIFEADAGSVLGIVSTGGRVLGLIRMSPVTSQLPFPPKRYVIWLCCEHLLRGAA